MDGHAYPYPAHAPEMRNTRGLVIALTILVLASVLSTLLQAAFSPTEVTVKDQQVVATRDGWAALTVPLGLAAIIVGLVWVFRVTSNARDVGDPRQPSPGWAVGSWFIPVAHIVLPYFPLATAWKKSRAGRMGPFVAWAVLYALAFLMMYVSVIGGAVWGFQAGSDAAPGETIVVEMPMWLQAVGWAGAALQLVAALLFIPVMQKFHRAQQAMAHHLARTRAAPMGGRPI
jgi:hypothetical protein